MYLNCRKISGLFHKMIWCIESVLGLSDVSTMWMRVGVRDECAAVVVGTNMYSTFDHHVA